MDEILIEEKKYISSKRAAKITGYAKDYIGQLCREGRVPARLVGRSWYVLETAIQDHRFGDSVVESEGKSAAAQPEVITPSTWEAPRYEASSEKILPSINRLDEQNPQDSWRAWFDTFNHTMDTNTTEPDTVAESEEHEQEEEKTEPEIEEEISVHVPIHTIHHTVPAELLPHRSEIQLPREERRQVEPTRHRGRKSGKAVMMAFQFFSILIALSLAAMATIGTGYFDKYLLSDSRASMFAGVTLYNK